MTKQEFFFWHQEAKEKLEMLEQILMIWKFKIWLKNRKRPCPAAAIAASMFFMATVFYVVPPS